MTHGEDIFLRQPEEEKIGNESRKSKSGESETLGPEDEGGGRPQEGVQERVLQVSLQLESYGTWLREVCKNTHVLSQLVLKVEREYFKGQPDLT